MFTKQRIAVLLATVLTLAWCTPVVAQAQTALPHGGYGAHANFGRFHGVGYQIHHGRNGEVDVNVCSHHVAPGVASCDARVVVTPSASTNATSSPVSSTVSSCSTTDTNAPSAVIAGGNGGYDPCYLQSAYNAATLAEGNGGVGQTVAIVDYTIDPNIASDLAAYRAQFGLPACPTGTVSPSNTGCVFQQVAQNGAPKSGTSGWDLEISLDVDTVSAICPKCQILLLETSNATTSALGAGVNTAVADGAIAVSNSYGGSESSSDPSAATTYYSHPGVAVTASTGDTAGLVEFPSSAPSVIAVGGTSLLQYSTLGTRSANATESVWDNTPAAGDGAGAGCSAYETVPSWQSAYLASGGGPGSCAKRVTADVSADADPNTGVWVYDSLTGGGWGIVGGTSLASPLTAALYGLSNNAVGSSVNPNSVLYANGANFYHVTKGNVGTCGTYLCDATHSLTNGFNGPTGIGTPGGAGALAAYAFNPATPPVTPAAPATPSVVSSTATSVNLSWPSVSGATSYNVYSGPSSTSLTLLATGVTATSYTATGLTPATSYSFAVSATNSAGTSAQSGAVSATTAALSAPSAPTGLTATGGAGSVSLAWTAPANNGGSAITGYTVYYSTTSGAELSGTAQAASGTSATVTGLATGTTYYFEVVATNAVGNSAPSTQVSASPVGVPSAPTLVSATSGSAGSGRVTLSWTAPTNNGGSAITGYTVYDGTTTPPTTNLGSVSATSTSASVSGLTPGTTYYFDIVAKNANGSSVASNILSVTAAIAPPSAPTNVSARASGTSVSVSWRSSSGTGVTYKVLVSTSSTMSNPTSYTVTGGSPYSVTGLVTTTTYYFQVVATNAGGSASSAVVSSLG